jgi:molybdopterin/thiamine biosynthesis adenylyltransferase/rhodanese-related sulfurtransferase
MARKAVSADITDLSREELQRYSRHLVLPEVGADGQRALKRARVLLVGAGGLGSPLGLYLAAAGVGTLGLVDDDVVDVTNLQRQVLFGVDDLGQPKVERAALRLRNLNPHVDVIAHHERLTAATAAGLVAPYDIVVDGSDNFPTRFCINDACVFAGKPNVFGSVYRFEGHVSVFDARRGPCYRCLFPYPPPPGSVPSCAEGGVLGIVPGLVGLIQATETIKMILGIGETLIGKLLVVDALRMRFTHLNLLKDPACPVCSAQASIHQLRDEAYACEAGGTNSNGDEEVISPRQLHAALQRSNAPALLDVREPAEREIAKLNNTYEFPIDELPMRLDDLPRDRDIVVYCLSGGRSARAVRLLREAGFYRVRGLAGGLRAWTEQVDPSLPRY